MRDRLEYRDPQNPTGEQGPRFRPPRIDGQRTEQANREVAARGRDTPATTETREVQDQEEWAQRNNGETRKKRTGEQTDAGD